MPGRAGSTASTASSRARATPARTALRFRSRPNRRKRWRRRCWPMATCCRSGSARATACGSRPGSASMATTSTRRRRRSRARWNGRSRRAAAIGGARAGGFPGADNILAQLETGAPRRRVGLEARRPRPGARRRGAVRGRNFDPSRSARSPRAASAPASMRRSRWAICRFRSPPRARWYSPKLRGAATAAAGRRHALRSQYLQTLNLQTPEDPS